MAANAGERPAPADSDARLRQPSGIRLVDDVAGSIEDAILAGRMRPGERLIETRLCAELGVSRTTLREALLILQQRGLVRSEPRRGTFVTRLSREDAIDLCRTRALLESYAVFAGFSKLDDEQFERMQAVIDELAVCNLPVDVPRLIQLDLQFHLLLVDCVDSIGVRELWNSLNGRMSAVILSSIEHHHANTGDLAEFHQVLLDAIRSGDPAVARDAVIAHYIGVERDETGTLAEIAGVIESMARNADMLAARLR
jgi:DNA-binding GntR family transcriptional regulator